MKIGQAFPSKYLKAGDIPEGQFVTVRIDRVQIEDVGGQGSEEDKPVLYFVGKQKGMVLNRTNSDAITHVYGDETEEWAGKPIQLYQTTTSFQGKTMPCIRVRVSASLAKQSAAPAPRAPAPPPPANPVGEEAEFDPESIPF